MSARGPDAVRISALLGLPAPTPEQVAVIEAPLEPALVVAGAGSGKTETMAARVLYVVAQGWVRPEEILGLTFTRKAAGGLAARIRTRLRALGQLPGLPEVVRRRVLSGEPTVSTYHAFGGSLIGEFGPLLGFQTTARVLTPTASWQLARSVVGRWDADLDTDQRPAQVTENLLLLAGGLADHLTGTAELASAYQRVAGAIELSPPSARQRLAVRPDLATQLTRLRNRLAVLPLIDAFAARKREAGVIDYGDQMALAAELALRIPLVGESLRDRFRLVLLDEYQDTGHAQRVILRALFGADPELPADRAPGHPVMAVGDPVQSIYSWRGASVSNLPRFVTDFRRAGGTEAARLTLSTSFRNASAVLDLANVMSARLREAPVAVPELRPRPGAPAGTVLAALHDTVDQEDGWVADRIAQAWRDKAAAGEPPPTTAVLLRRRADAEPLAAALRSRGLPVQVVGVGGLLAVPEVADLLALLRVLVDPSAGDAAVRLLTGARWRLGMADLDRLSRRAAELSAREPDPGAGATPADRVRHALRQADPGEDVDQGSLIDALADPGPPDGYSPEGRARIERLAAELSRLRSRLHQPLPDLLADLEHSTGLDVEVQLHRPDGRVHLDAFAAIVADVAGTGAGPTELLEYLSIAEDREDGLAQGEPEPVPGQVQVMTVHAAKGLEWEIVAVPHLVDKLFPSTRNRTWLSDAAQPAPEVRGDQEDLPRLFLPAGADQKVVEDAIKEHTEEFKELIAREERRLFYVAVTRAERQLLLSGHHWGRTATRPAGPSTFLTEVVESGLLDRSQIPVWASAPADGDSNPVTAAVAEVGWPADPLGQSRAVVQQGAGLVLAALSGQDEPEAGGAGDPTWERDVSALLAERSGRREPDRIRLPGSLSVTGLVDLTIDPDGYADRIRRPLPRLPSPAARVGTAFHHWVERWYAGEPLLEVGQLPGAGDADLPGPEAPGLDRLRDRFLGSSWAARTPLETEVGFALTLGGIPVRGRIDAVFDDGDGRLLVVDWKTGPPRDNPEAAVQLAVYRLAASALYDRPPAAVRAAFVHVGSDTTVAPVDLATEEELTALLARAQKE